MDFAVSAHPRIKVKESEKLDRSLKRLGSMKISVIPIVVGALETVPKGLEKTPAVGGGIED